MTKLTNFLAGTNRRKSASSRRPQRVRLPVAVEGEILEERLVLSPGILAIGVGSGSAPRVGVFDSTNGAPLYEFNPYPDFPGFTGGVRTAVGYVPDSTGASVFPVVITAPGPGLTIGDPVRVFSGVEGTLYTGQHVPPAQQIASINPYPGFSGGIYVGAADFNLDGFSEVITGAGPGGGPHVKAISLGSLTEMFSAFAYAPGFTGGVQVAAGIVNPLDNRPDLITGAGPGGGPHVKVYNGLSGVVFPGAAGSFFAYSANFTGGVFVAAGDFDGNGTAEIVTGAGPGGGPHVRIIPPFGSNPNNPQFDLNQNTTSFPYSPSFTGGVRVAAAYINSDQIADLIVARGPGGVSDTIVYSGPSATVLYQGPSFTNPLVTSGSFPSSGKFLNEALRLAEDVAPPAETPALITFQDVQPLYEAALARLQEAGVSQEAVNQLQALDLQVANLGGNALGIAYGNGIVIDDDAAGLGWFLDPTPSKNDEYNADGSALLDEASARVDLLTVVLHELGHHLGLGDLDPATHPHNLMTGTFNPGERRLPNPRAVDSLFSGEDLFDRLLAPSLF